MVEGRSFSQTLHSPDGFQVNGSLTVLSVSIPDEQETRHFVLAQICPCLFSLLLVVTLVHSARSSHVTDIHFVVPVPSIHMPMQSRFSFFVEAELC